MGPDFRPVHHRQNLRGSRNFRTSEDPCDNQPETHRNPNPLLHYRDGHQTVADRPATSALGSERKKKYMFFSSRRLQRLPARWLHRLGWGCCQRYRSRATRFHFTYTIALKPGNPLSNVQLNQTMTLRRDGIVENRARIRALGVPLSRVTEQFRRVDSPPAAVL